MSKHQSTKVVELGSCAFRQWRATHSHCQYLHGYQLKAKLWFGCNELDEKNWCVDFGSLNKLKQHLKDLFDHTTTVALDDPELETFKELDKKGLIQLRVFDDGVGIEKAAQVVFEHANEYVKAESKNRCWVAKVEVFEHEDNSATYSDCCKKDTLDDTLMQSLEQIDVDDVSEVAGVSVSVSSPKTVKDEEVPSKVPPVNTKKQVLPDLPGNSTKTKGDWFKGTTWG